MTHRTTLRIIYALLCWGALSVFGQSISGNLTGTIYDPSGATVPGARVLARNEATGVETSTVSTSSGQYSIPNLPVGSYTITVNAPGFVQAQVKGVGVALNQTVTSNVKLDVGQATQTVEVTAAGASIDTTTAQVQSSFQSQDLAEMPTASTGSGVINLSLLNAGVASSGGVGAGTGPSVAGQRPRDNNFTIEGIDNNNDSVTGPVVSVPNDAVQEFTVLQNQFSAEFGHSTGGQFNQVVKSGGNEFHGALYEYMQNRNLDAADNLSYIDQNPLHPRFDDNRFGGNLGGPIRKNKLFFFADYEYNPIGNSASGGLIYAPTQSGYSTLSSMPGINRTNLGILQKYLGVAPSAASTAAVGGSYPLVGPGNLSLGNQLPGAAPIPIGQIGITAPSYTNNENAVLSIDDNVSDMDNVRLRFILNRSGAIDTAASLPAFFTTTPTNSYIFTLSEFHTFNPTTTNEFRLGYNRLFSNDPVGNYTYPGLDQFPNITLYELGGVNIGPDPNAPQFTIQNTYQLTDNVNITHGNHTIRFGFDGYRLISPSSFTQRSRGDYEYSYLSDFLFDYNPDYIAQRSLGNVTYYGNRNFAAGYVNDAWKVRPNLTIDLGLRYEFVSVPLTEQTQTLNAISNVPGLINFQKPLPQTNAWMPRIGIAYSPGTSGKTSIRAGFGRNFDVLFDNLGLLSLPPQEVSTVDVTGFNQGGFLAHGGIAPNTSGGALSQADARAGTGGYIPNEIRPESYQWNFGVQHVFHNDYTVESRYVGTRGIHLPVQEQLNRQSVVNASNALPLFYSAAQPGHFEFAHQHPGRVDEPVQRRWEYRARLPERRIHRDYHQLPAVGQFHVSRMGQSGDAPVHQRIPTPTGLHLQPRYRRFHRGSVQHLPDSAPPPGFPEPASGSLQFGPGPPAAVDRRRLVRVQSVQERELDPEEHRRQLGNLSDLHLSDRHLVRCAERGGFQPEWRFGGRPGVCESGRQRQCGIGYDCTEKQCGRYGGIPGE